MWQRISDLRDFPDSASSGSVVAIGNFDGVHLGHQKLIDFATQHALSLGLPTWVFTFSPHPSLVFQESGFHLLTTADERASLIRQLGVDGIVEQPFVPAFYQLTAADFFNQILLQILRVRLIVVGYDFCFGRAREGSLSLLDDFCRQVRVELQVVPAYQIEGEVPSSTRIREQVRSRRFLEARKLLGRDFFYSGRMDALSKRGEALVHFELPKEKRGFLPNGGYLARLQIEEPGGLSQERVAEVEGKTIQAWIFENFLEFLLPGSFSGQSFFGRLSLFDSFSA